MRKFSVFVMFLLLMGSIFSCTASPSTTDYDSIYPILKTDDLLDTVAVFDDTYVFTEENITSMNGLSQISGMTLTISSAGVYLLTGSSDNANIIVNSGSSDNVILVLSGLELVSLEGSVIKVLNADKVVIHLVEGTVSILTDTSLSSGCIDSSDDLSFNGNGTLEIHSVSNGINTNDDLIIAGGTYDITAKNDGLKVNNNLVIQNADLSITAKNDGLHSENTDSDDLGNILFKSGTLDVSAYGDALHASNLIIVYDGVLDLASGVSNSKLDTISGKGIKGTSEVAILGGEISIVSKDDAIHTNGEMSILGGTITCSSGDDGLHADERINIENANIVISKSYEGIESIEVNIYSGIISVTASDDGINISGGADGSAANNFGGGMDALTEGAILRIYGGLIYVNAVGDGTDSNGSIEMSGGTLIVSGPTSSNNGALDYNGTFKMTGGILIAVGSTGMAENISSNSTQNGVIINMTSSTTKLIRLVDSAGTEIITFKSSKSVQSIVISTPNLSKGKTYSLYLGGTISDPTSSFNGYTIGGAYTTGTLYQSFTMSSKCMSVGTSGGMW